MTAKRDPIRLVLALSLSLTLSLLAAVPAARAERLRVVMLGDSLTAGCDWQARLPGAEVLNQGISGDSTWSITARLDQVVAAKPGKIFLQAGINDFGRNPAPEAILKRHEAIWQNLRERLPEAELYIVSLLPVSAVRYPRWGRPVVRLNHLLKESAEERGLVYIDLHSRMVDQEGGLREELTYDGRHLVPRAYDLWVEAVRPHIDRVAETPGPGGAANDGR